MVVLDAFAGTGALGLEALSRGAARATFLERDRAALGALRANVRACGAETARVFEADAFRPPPAREAANLVFLDPPYGQGAPARALDALGAAGWIEAGALVVVETARDEEVATAGALLVERRHGAACLRVFLWSDGNTAEGDRRVPV
jgi:16S rRNA (guanine966-N2)-methyltransferase